MAGSGKVASTPGELVACAGRNFLTASTSMVAQRFPRIWQRQNSLSWYWAAIILVVCTPALMFLFAAESDCVLDCLPVGEQCEKFKGTACSGSFVIRNRISNS